MDNYEKKQRIGRGNYGTVYLARDVRSGRWRCLKMILMEAHSDDEREQAMREVSVLRKLDHPGVAWNGSNLLGLVYKIVQEKYPPVPERYSDDLKQLIGAMLAKDPSHRPSLAQILHLPFIRAKMEQLFNPRACSDRATASSSCVSSPVLSASRASTPAIQPCGRSGMTSSVSGHVSLASTPTALPAAAIADVRCSAPSRGQRWPVPQSDTLQPSDDKSTAEHSWQQSMGSPDEPMMPVMTPKERMRQRKQLEADRRSVELKLAAELRMQEKEVAQRIGARQFASELNSVGCVPFGTAGRSNRLSDALQGAGTMRGQGEGVGGGALSAEQSEMRYQARANSAGGESSERLQGRTLRCGSDQGEMLAYTGNGGHSVACNVGASKRMTGRSVTARECHTEGEGSGIGGHTESVSSPYFDGQCGSVVYEDDFEDDIDEELEHEGDVSNESGRRAIKAAQMQAQASSGSQARQQLKDIAREHLEHESVSAAEVALEELPVDGAALIGGSTSKRARQHTALQERCYMTLGDSFLPVYQYLRHARDTHADEGEVRRNLKMIVGQERVKDCMCVDELVFIEQAGA
ncbi:MAG: hypothetical protein SGPRY_010343 [Prymnesium sp.]